MHRACTSVIRLKSSPDSARCVAGGGRGRLNTPARLWRWAAGAAGADSQPTGHSKPQARTCVCSVSSSWSKRWLLMMPDTAALRRSTPSLLAALAPAGGGLSLSSPPAAACCSCCCSGGPALLLPPCCCCCCSRLCFLWGASEAVPLPPAAASAPPVTAGVSDARAQSQYQKWC